MCSSREKKSKTISGFNSNLFSSLIYPSDFFTANNLERPLDYGLKYYFEVADLNIVKKMCFIYKM